MYLYGIGTLPFIHSLKSRDHLHQVCYANDASACGLICLLHGWFNDLLRLGPSYGYFAEPSKCSLVVDKLLKDEAGEICKSFNINIVTNQRFLGGMIGDIC